MELILIISILFQLAAVLIAIRLIVITEKYFAWFLIATAITFMAVRRTISLFAILDGTKIVTGATAAEYVALGISIFLSTGLFFMVPIFKSIKRNEKELIHKNEELVRARMQAEDKEKLIELQYKDIQESEEELRKTNEELLKTTIAHQKNNERLTTAQQKAEKNLIDLNRAQGIAHLGSWYLDIATNEVAWTEELYKMYGFDPALPVPPYTEHMKLFTPESWELLSASLAKTSETGVPYELELKTIREDKTNGWMWVRGEAVFDENEKIVGLWGAAQDITERKQLEIELVDAKENAEKNEELYRGLIKNLRAGIVIHAKDTSIIMCNRQAEELLGLSSDQMTGKVAIDPHWKFIYEDNNPIPVDDYPVLRVIKTKSILDKQILGVTRKKDDIVWLIVNGFPVFDSNNEIIQVVISFIDITAQKQGELLLRKKHDEINIRNEEYQLLNEKLIKAKEKAEESEHKIRSMYENTQIGILFCDTQGKVLEANPAILEILGSPSLEATKKINLLTFPPLLEVGFAQNVAKCIKEQITIEEDTTYKSKWGKTVFMKYYLVPVIINDKVIGVWANLNNLSDLWEIQNELVTSKEKAEESDRLKSEFINNMSHEIRTPMNGIMGFTKFLSNPALTDEKRKYYINIVLNSGQQLLRIIDDILEISKLGTKQVKLTETETCLNDLLLEQFSIFDIKAKEKKTPLYLKRGLSDEESTIFVDSNKLNKILSNLLENAMKFTNEGYIEFGYKLENEKLVIYVKDTGIGISLEKQEMVFERFSQAEEAKINNTGGLGLGLSIAKENAELLGGSIYVKSERKKGSTFFVSIPYKPMHTKIITNNNSEGKQESCVVLIVEDEEVNYLYLETLLEGELGLDVKILHAKDGAEGVEICKKNLSICLVLMDIKMPILNGYEATKMIKKVRPELPVIAQTAYSTREDKEKASAAGIDDFISKPIDIETLRSITDKYLKI